MNCRISFFWSENFLLFFSDPLFAHYVDSFNSNKENYNGFFYLTAKTNEFPTGKSRLHDLHGFPTSEKESNNSFLSERENRNYLRKKRHATGKTSIPFLEKKYIMSPPLFSLLCLSPVKLHL